MNIHEYQAVNLFRKSGIPVGGGQVAQSVEEALKLAREIGYPLVLKAQVLTGGRGKAGGVKLVSNDDELTLRFNEIRNLTIKGYRVEKILLVKAIHIQKEYYGAVTIANVQGDVVIIASSEGGVDIEETARTAPEKILKFYLNKDRELKSELWEEFISTLFSDVGLREKGTDIFRKLLDVFYANDCSLAEINPLVVDGNGDLVAADAKVNIDDNALYRQAEIAEQRDIQYEEPDELEAKEYGLSFVKLDGNVGCIVNGAGLAMGTLDAIKLMGGDPANFLDVGGSSNPQKVTKALEIILRNPNVKSILINIFGGITRCDDIAKGILEALERIEISVPLVVRLTGTNEQEAKELLSESGLTVLTSMREAVTEAVRVAQGGES